MWYRVPPRAAFRIRRINTFEVFYEERRTPWPDEAQRVAEEWRRRGHRARVVKDGPFADWKVFRSRDRG